MSNRARRRWLRDKRLLASMAYFTARRWPIPEVDESMEEWNRWERSAFRSIQRRPLEFTGNQRTDSRLIDIQLKNRPEPFNPLRDNVPAPPEYPEKSAASDKALTLWRDAEEAIDGALDYLEPARKVSRPRFDIDPGNSFLNVPRFDDFTVAIHRAFRKLSNNLMSVHQYGDGGNPWFAEHGQAARSILDVDPKGEITEVQLYALLALAAGRQALITLEYLPDDPAAWGDDLGDVAERLQETERWLAEAYRLEQLETEKGTAAAAAPDTKRGEELRLRLARQKDAAVLASTVYPEAVKDQWRQFDKAAVSIGKKKNKSDRVRAVLKNFFLPDSAFKTVSRALN